MGPSCSLHRVPNLGPIWAIWSKANMVYTWAICAVLSFSTKHLFIKKNVSSIAIKTRKTRYCSVHKEPIANVRVFVEDWKEMSEIGPMVIYQNHCNVIYADHNRFNCLLTTTTTIFKWKLSTHVRCIRLAQYVQ